MSLISVTDKDLSIGVSLPWPVMDQEGNVLMRKGAVIESEEQLQRLLAGNPVRELNREAMVPAPDAAEGGDDEGLEAALAEGQKGAYSFQDMRLRVGDRILLEPPQSVSQKRCAVKLIGYLENASLLVTAPVANGMRLPIEENDLVVARIFDSQKAFGFSSTVQRVCKIPYSYLHLSFPERVQGSLIRKSPRIRTRIIASVARPDEVDKDKQSAIIVNLSANGALLKARQPISGEGQKIRLVFSVNLHKVDAYLKLNAIIRSIFADDDKGSKGEPMFNHGVQFEELPPDDNMILQSLIYQQMVEQPQSLV